MTEFEWIEPGIANLRGRIRVATHTLTDPKLPAVGRDRERARIALYRRYLADLLTKRDALHPVVSGYEPPAPAGSPNLRGVLKPNRTAQKGGEAQ